jgi:hypothetical protein
LPQAQQHEEALGRAYIPHVALEAVVGVVAEELQLLLHRRRAVRLKLHFAPIRGHQHVHHCITALPWPHSNEKFPKNEKIAKMG